MSALIVGVVNAIRTAVEKMFRREKQYPMVIWS